MRQASVMIVALGVVLMRASAAQAQAGRFIPIRLPPSPGGGGHFIPHLPIHFGDSVMWYILGFAGVCALVYVGWMLGQALGSRLRHGPQEPRASWSPTATVWNTPPPDLILQPFAVAARAEQTRLLLEFLAHQDPILDPCKLHEEFARIFFLVQKAWEARDYQSVRDLILPELLARHENLLGLMRTSHEINRIDDLGLERLEFVHLNCPKSLRLQEVTALITFRASVYFVHDRTGAFTRGQRSPGLFQEFWVFRRGEYGWQLLDIERSHASGRLRRSNYVGELNATQLANAQSSITL
jgi:hypothetical protein